MTQGILTTLVIGILGSRFSTFRKDTSLKQRKGKANSPLTGLEWPRGFQEVNVPRFHDKGTGWW